jgi:hypothetical protein
VGFCWRASVWRKGDFEGGGEALSAISALKRCCNDIYNGEVFGTLEPPSRIRDAYFLLLVFFLYKHVN